MKNILCFGDSLTAGYYNEGNDFHPYSEKLAELTGTHIDHIGLSGFTADEMIDNTNNSYIEDYVNKKWTGLSVQLKKKEYDLCIILAGTNDISDGDGSVTITADILKLHSIAGSHGCNTVALTIPRIKFESADNTITKLREQINRNLINNAELFSKNEYRVIDLAAELGDNYEYMDDDGLHFKPEGYDEIARIISTYLK